MSVRPALVDLQGGPITGKEGGPMSLAKPAINWSHVTGKRHERHERAEPQRCRHPRIQILSTPPSDSVGMSLRFGAGIGRMDHVQVVQQRRVKAKISFPFVWNVMPPSGASRRKP